MKTRIYFLDNFRTFLILLVVILHSGLVYEPVLENSWIVVDPVKNNNIGLIRLYLDLFAMFSIFFVSGYFVPASVKKQSAVSFLKSKFKRIMLPWVIGVLTLIPAYKFIFLYSRGLPQEAFYTYFHWFQRGGSDLSFFANNPVQNWLWFLPVLFVFQVVYLGLYRAGWLKINISLRTAVILVFGFGTIYGVTVSSLGLSGWYHSIFFHFQNERLLVYLLAFLLGSLCYKLQVFQGKGINKKTYIVSNVVIGFSLTVFTGIALNTFFNLIDPQRNFYFISALGDRIIYYASATLSMLTLLHVFLYSFQKYLNRSGNLINELTRNSYSVYIIHMIVLGVIAITLQDIPVPAFLKFIVLSILTFAGSNLLITAWRMTIKKQFTMKTFAAATLAGLILVITFSQNNRLKAQSKNETSQAQCSENIHAAVINGDLASVVKLIASGADVNEKDPASGSSPLLTAALFGRTEIVQQLLNSGAEINFQNFDGSTALHTAAFLCRTQIVNLLLQKGAKKTIRNKGGATALESVQAPFEIVKPIYDYLQTIYKPLGLNIDQERIKKTRPEIAQMLSE